MKIAVTGSSGLIGSALVPRCVPTATTCCAWCAGPPGPRTSTAGTRSTAGSTRPCSATSTPWSTWPGRRSGRGRGPPAIGERLLTSRVDSTATVCQALAEARRRRPGPAAGAAVRLGGRLLRRHRATDRRRGRPGRRRTSSPRCARSGRRRPPRRQAAGVRVVHLRTGLVLGRRRMLVKVLGRSSGSASAGGWAPGEQYWPWISLRDEVDAMRFLLTADVSGPVNLTGPAPGDQRGVHPRPGPAGAPPGGAAGARVRDLAGPRRVRPGQRAGRPAGGARPRSRPRATGFRDADLDAALQAALARAYAGPPVTAARACRCASPRRRAPAPCARRLAPGRAPSAAASRRPRPPCTPATGRPGPARRGRPPAPPSATPDHLRREAPHCSPAAAGRRPRQRRRPAAHCRPRRPRRAHRGARREAPSARRP